MKKIIPLLAIVFLLSSSSAFSETLKTPHLDDLIDKMEKCGAEGGSMEYFSLSRMNSYIGTDYYGQYDVRTFGRGKDDYTGQQLVKYFFDLFEGINTDTDGCLDEIKQEQLEKAKIELLKYLEGPKTQFEVYSTGIAQKYSYTHYIAFYNPKLKRGLFFVAGYED